MKNCYYKILGVSVHASQEEIRKTFRMLALRLHPDHNPLDSNAAGRFREVLEAYEVLIDSRKRFKYDCLHGYRQTKGRSHHRSHETFVETDASFGDILNEAFGIHFDSPRISRGNDLRFDLQLPRSAVAGGAFEDIDYERRTFCNSCTGNGRKVPLSSCEKCHGSGELEEVCSVKVWIPAGARQGARLRIPGGGDRPSPWVRAGDLVILLHIVEGR